MKTTPTSDNVIPLQKPKAATAAGQERQADLKWSKLVMKQGYSIIPVILLHGQKRLGLSPAQLNVLLQIASHWWSAADLPYPSKQTLANRMGCTTRQVQRHLTALETAGLITRIKRSSLAGGQMSNRYSFAGLVKKLGEIAKDYQEASDAKKQRRVDLEKRGGGKLRKA